MDSSHALSVTQIDAVRQHRVYRLADVVQLKLRVPELQRASDQDRVAAIVKYQESRPSRRTFFAGSLTIALNSDGPWLVDGQHRFMAMRELVAKLPDMHNDRVSVEVVDLRETDAPSMAGLFELINCAVPVPDYIVKGMLDHRQRSMLDAFTARFVSEFKPFVSQSSAPRRPNINVATLVDRMARAGHLIERVPDAATLFSYVSFVNNKLAGRDFQVRMRADAKAEKARNPGGALYLSADPDAAWAHDARAVNTFLVQYTFEDKDSVSTRTQEAGRKPSRPAAASLPMAVRRAVWNRDAGPLAGSGPCACCGATVTQQSFECGHVKSRRNGGSDHVSNLKVLCTSCNRSMGVRDFDAFKQEYFKELS
jgi:hypothetical protein